MEKFLPNFQSVRLITNRTGYEEIYQSPKTAWLLAENESLWEFIEQLAEVDEKSSYDKPLNLYDFYIAYNLKFPRGAVTLQNKSVKDFAELLNDVIQSSNGSLSVNVNLEKLKIKILQQFIYLRIYLPINNQKSSGDIGIFGTKKAGKSTLINALLGDEYDISSPLLPTPNKVIYTAAKDNKKISLTYKNAAHVFNSVDELQKFLQEEVSAANKNFSTLENMLIALPKFPTFFSGARLINTPSSNFVVGKSHAQVLLKMRLICSIKFTNILTTRSLTNRF